MYRLKFDKKVLKFFLKHKWEKVSILFEKYAMQIKLDPYTKKLDIKKIQWWENKYRLRIWKYRFLYEIIDNEILIYFYDAGSRWDIYK